MPAIIATVGVILAAVYVLWMYQRMMTGPHGRVRQALPRPGHPGKMGSGSADRGHHRRRLLPKPLLDVINPAVNKTLSTVQVDQFTPAVADKKGEAGQ